MTQVAPRSRQAGFTIIELLIATAVFSVILLVITTAVLQFTKQYYRGVVASSTQNVARTLIDDVSRSIEFNGGAVSPISGNTGYCIGSDKRYSYKLSRQVTDGGGDPAVHQGLHALVSDTVTGCNGSTPALNVTTLGSLSGGSLQNPRELLGQHMRLAKFNITPVGSDLYTITVRVIYGDDDLLTSPTSPSATCLGTTGSQFCAVSELTTTVKKRVN